MASSNWKSNVTVHILRAVRFRSEESAFHKDFKISGVIEEARQKDKLSYVSLLKQIEEGNDKGYSYKETVNAVIKAVALGLYLRNVLKTIDKLTLNRLMKTERNALDLRQHLTSFKRSNIR